MALPKTFVAGQPLSAADVNDHLVNRVPSPGAPPTDGPVDLFNAGGVHITLVRDGLTVTIWASGNVPIPSMGRPFVGPTNIVPADLRPARDVFGALELRWLQHGIGTLSLDTAGSLAVWNPTTSTNADWSGSVTYTVAG